MNHALSPIRRRLGAASRPAAALAAALALALVVAIGLRPAPAARASTDAPAAAGAALLEVGLTPELLIAAGCDAADLQAVAAAASAADQERADHDAARQARLDAARALAAARAAMAAGGATPDRESDLAAARSVLSAAAQAEATARAALRQKIMDGVQAAIGGDGAALCEQLRRTADRQLPLAYRALDLTERQRRTLGRALRKVKHDQPLSTAESAALDAANGDAQVALIQSRLDQLDPILDAAA